MLEVCQSVVRDGAKTTLMGDPVDFQGGMTFLKNIEPSKISSLCIGLLRNF